MALLKRGNGDGLEWGTVISLLWPALKIYRYARKGCTSMSIPLELRIDRFQMWSPWLYPKRGYGVGLEWGTVSSQLNDLS
ncbi:hypothetical protein [Absidia glauca]|uniref:Uncharacterized protein n=1 Tax=Absidia glauca TaxID=4829 RepID=A0A163JF99_ABSGL|nr:hypothetical protein [Absidia glauca]